MGRVIFLASLATILFIGNVNSLGAQGRGGMGATGGAASAGAHGSAMAAPARSAAGHMTSSPGSHLAIPRSPSGQLMPRRAGTTLRATGRNGSTSARTRQFRSTRGAGLDFSDESNVPGLGFDAVHVAATRGNRAGVGRDRDHDRGRRNEFGVLFPFFDGGGYYVPTGPDISGDVPGDGQGVDDAEDQGPGPDDRPYPYDRAPGSANRPPAEQPGPQANVPEYVFVRRDGTVFFAVAYSWDQGSLRYISSEGTRRSVSRDTLDLKATEEFNEQRGLTFRSPA
jgi:hypothetical protein